MGEKGKTGLSKIQFTPNGLIRPLFDLLADSIREKVRRKKKNGQYGLYGQACYF